ncbi:MAG: DNA-directed RNA polymerase subunit P [Nanopusillaceae archaeon]
MIYYLCINCGRKVPHDQIKKRVKCPYCGGKILIKTRSNFVKHIKAR